MDLDREGAERDKFNQRSRQLDIRRANRNGDEEESEDNDYYEEDDFHGKADSDIDDNYYDEQDDGSGDVS